MIRLTSKNLNFYKFVSCILTNQKTSPKASTYLKSLYVFKQFQNTWLGISMLETTILNKFYCRWRRHFFLILFQAFFKDSCFAIYL